MDTNINIRTDKELKQEADAIFKELGLNMSTAINMFLSECVRVNGLPLEMRLNEELDRKTIRAIKQGERRMKYLEKHPDKVRDIGESDEAFEKALGVKL